MTHTKTLTKISSLAAAAAFMIGCGSGGLPSNLEQTSTNVQGAPEQYLPLSLNAPGSAVLTQGATVQLAAMGGKLPYHFTTNGGSITDSSGIYSASTVGGPFRVTVTDAQGLTAYVDLTVNAPASTTAPPVTTTPPPVVTPSTQAIYRNFNTLHGLHMIALTGAVTGDGWRSEGQMYSTYVTSVTGMSTLYVCQMAVSAIPAYFQSRDPACEGNIPFSSIGLVYNTQQAGTVPLIRFSKVYSVPGAGVVTDHIDLKEPSLDPATFTVPPGYAADGALGFVPQ